MRLFAREGLVGRFLPFLALAILALVGQLVVLQAAATVFGGHLGFGFDFLPIWRTGVAIVHGARPALSAASQNFYPLPEEMLFIPLGLLPAVAAQILTLGATAALLIVTPWLWVQRRPYWQGVLLVLLSLPVISTATIDQFQSALGVAAVSLLVWAHNRQRWSLVGVGAALALIRPVNALPVLIMLVIAVLQKRTGTRAMLISAGAILVPASLVATSIAPGWGWQYVAALHGYPVTGLLGMVKGQFGIVGIFGLTVLLCSFAVWLMRETGGILEPDAVAAVLALSVLVAPLPGLYCLVFVIPAVLRVGQRPRLAAAPWLVSITPWLIVLVLSPELLGPNPLTTLNLLPTLNLWLVAAAFPLFRVWPSRATSAASNTAFA
jgi:hypothetical protein